MRPNQICCKTPTTVTIHMKSGSRSHQQKKVHLKRPIFKENKGIYESNAYNNNIIKRPKVPCLIIQRQEMTAFFKLFDDDLIQDFLWMDCCCKVADKVMEIAPTHYIWQRERSDHHSGAVRNYSKEETQLPRGPCATPLDCLLCGKKGRFIGLGLSSSSSSSSSTTLRMKEQIVQQDSPESFTGDKMVIDPPESYCSSQDSQTSMEPNKCFRYQDKSMEWFTGNEE
ncbi:hypothetical protein FKM82_010109 [Ascaphus truei]